MPFFSKDERDNVKRFLDDVMDDKSLASEFKKAKARKDGICSDYTDAMLGQYMGMIKEIQEERAERHMKAAKGTTPGPSLEQLRKKYLGPKHK